MAVVAPSAKSIRFGGSEVCEGDGAGKVEVGSTLLGVGACAVIAWTVDAMMVVMGTGAVALDAGAEQASPPAKNTNPATASLTPCLIAMLVRESITLVVAHGLGSWLGPLIPPDAPRPV